MTYHGELEKKAAMEQKRNLAGDEANGHEDVAAGIYRVFNVGAGRRNKRRLRPPTNSKIAAGVSAIPAELIDTVAPQSAAPDQQRCAPLSIPLSDTPGRARVKEVNRLAIPAAFLRRPGSSERCQGSSRLTIPDAFLESPPPPRHLLARRGGAAVFGGGGGGGAGGGRMVRRSGSVRNPSSGRKSGDSGRYNGLVGAKQDSGYASNDSGNVWRCSVDVDDRDLPERRRNSCPAIMQRIVPPPPPPAPLECFLRLGAGQCGLCSVELSAAGAAWPDQQRFSRFVADLLPTMGAQHLLFCF